MELHDAVAQIAEIRHQLAESTTFRGYRPATTAFTGVVALATAFTQSLLIADPVREPYKYVDLWIIAAITCLVVVGAELVFWARRSASRMRSEMTVAAVHQFAPCIVAGGLLTVVIANYQGNVIWMLSGLWPILFGIGMFASVRLVGKGLTLVGGFYLLAGLLILTRTPPSAMQPWCMGLTFAIGQFMAAAILYLKRRSEVSNEVE